MAPIYTRSAALQHAPATPLANSTAAPVYLTRVVAGKCRGRHTEATRLRPSADRHAGRPGDAARDLLQQSDGAAAGAACSKPGGPSLRQPMHPTPLSEARPPAWGCPNCPRLGGEHSPLGTPKRGFGRVLWECLLARCCADSNTCGRSGWASSCATPSGHFSTWRRPCSPSGRWCLRGSGSLGTSSEHGRMLSPSLMTAD